MIEIFGVNIKEDIEMKFGEHLLPFVDEAKQERIKKFYKWEDAQRTLLGDLLTRYIIMQKTQLKNAEISFTTNRYGKPKLTSREDMHFNLSHSGNWIVCAFDKQPIGIDVEKINPGVDLNIAKNYFSSVEHSDLLGKPDKYSYFFSLWTLKESFIKNVGKGLSLPLSSFSLRFMGNNEIKLEIENQEVFEKFFKVYHIEDYKLAVCAEREAFPGQITEISVEELIDTFLGKGFYFSLENREHEAVLVHNINRPNRNSWYGRYAQSVGM